MASPGYHLKWILTLIWCDGFFFFFFYHLFSSLFLCVLKWNVNFINATSAMAMPSCMLFGFGHAIHYPLHVRKCIFYLFLHFSSFAIYFENAECWGKKPKCVRKKLLWMYWISIEHREVIGRQIIARIFVWNLSCIWINIFTFSLADSKSYLLRKYREE